MLVARRPEALEGLAQELGGGGATVHVITADLADTAAVPGLAAQVRELVGSPGATIVWTLSPVTRRFERSYAPN